MLSYTMLFGGQATLVGLRLNAVKTLLELSDVEARQKAVADAGALEPLCALLVDASARLREGAAGTLDSNHFSAEGSAPAFSSSPKSRSTSASSPA